MELGAILLAIAVVVVLTLFITDVHPDLDQLRGAAALAAFAATLFATGWLITQPDISADVRVLPVTAAAIVTARIIASDWRTRSFMIGSAVLVVSLGVLYTVVGRDALVHADERGVERRSIEIRTEKQQLADEAQATAAALEADVSAAGRALQVLVAAERNEPATTPTDEYTELLTAAVTQSTGGTFTSEQLASLQVRVASMNPPAGPRTATLLATLQASVEATSALTAHNHARGCLPPPSPATTTTDATTSTTTTTTSSTTTTTTSPPESTTTSTTTPLADQEFLLAECRAGLTGDPADVAAANKLDLERAVASEVPPDRETVGVLEAIRNGPEAVLRELTPGGDDDAHRGDRDDDRALTAGPVGWAILAALVLLIWLWTARVNARAQTGPVDVTSVTDPDFKIALLKNVAEPGAAPGSIAISPVTDLLGVVEPTTVVKRAIEAALTLAGKAAGGYVVTCEHIAPAEPPATTDAAKDPAGKDATAKDGEAKAEKPVHEVVVKVSPKFGRDAFVNSVQAPTKKEAMRAAGYLTAAEILSRSPRVPSWSRWAPGTESALGVASALKISTDDLEAALRMAPSSGVLLAKLGERRETEGRPIEAIELYCRALAAHPNYDVAAYRLAGALNMLWVSPKPWRLLTADRRTELKAALVRAADSVGVQQDLRLLDLLDIHSEAGSAGEVKAFEQYQALPHAWFERLRKRASYLSWAGAMLRRSERDHLAPGRRRIRDRRLVLRSGELIAGKANRLPHIEKKAGQRQSSWQISYNLACHYARTHQYDHALRALEQALTRPGSHQLTRQWARADPDLQTLRSIPRFERFCAQLKENSDGS